MRREPPVLVTPPPPQREPPVLIDQDMVGFAAPPTAHEDNEQALVLANRIRDDAEALNDLARAHLQRFEKRHPGQRESWSEMGNTDGTERVSLRIWNGVEFLLHPSKGPFSQSDFKSDLFRPFD